MNRWTEADIPDLTGRVAVVTGANTGLGFETARALAEHGARVVLACRDRSRAEDAARRITERSPGTSIDCVELDLADLSWSAPRPRRSAADSTVSDLSINNAGVTGLTGAPRTGSRSSSASIIWAISPSPGCSSTASSRLPRRESSPSAASATGSAGSTPPTRPQRPEIPMPSRTGEPDVHLRTRRRLAGTPAEALAAHPGGASTEVFRYSPAAFRLPHLAIARLCRPHARHGRAADAARRHRYCRVGRPMLRPSGLSRSADSRDRPRPPSVRTSATARLGCGRYPKN